MQTKTTIRARSLHAENSAGAFMVASVLCPRLVADGYGDGVVFHQVSLSVRRRSLMGKKMQKLKQYEVLFTTETKD